MASPPTLSNLVVDATPDRDLEWRLRLALQVAAAYGGDLLAVCSAWPGGITLSEVITHTPLGSHAKEQELRNSIASAKLVFDRLTKDSAVNTEWCASIADPAVALHDHALLADLVILGAPDAAGEAHVDPVELAGRSGAPVLRLGASAATAPFANVLIGWKARREARCALRAALPILHQAERIVLVGVGDEAAVAALSAVRDYLAGCGLQVEVMSVEDDAGAPASMLAAIARREGCQLIVAGARSRGR